MSSWLAALGPCASPKSKTRKNARSLEKPLNLSSLKRRGSLTDIRQSRKVTGSRSFREKLQDTFDGSLRRAKKAGSLEAVSSDGRPGFYGNPDTNMNVATSLSPKSHSKGHSVGVSAGAGQELNTAKDKFWTNFYNTLPRNRHKSDRPKDLSLQDLPVTERDSDTDLSSVQSKDSDMSDVNLRPSDAQWANHYATSPRTKRKAKTLERMNSAPSTRKSPMMKNYDGDGRAASDGQASPQIIHSGDEIFDSNGGFIIMPRSVSLQDDYWVPASKGGSRIELRRVTPSPDRMMIRGSPSANPMQVQGHVWVKTKDGAHMELRAIEQHCREQPSPSDSQKTDLSTLSYTTAASSLSHLELVPKFPAEDRLPGGYVSSTTQTPDQPYTGSYMSPEEYQANIFDLINSLNQSPPNPASPEVRRSKDGKQQPKPANLELKPGSHGPQEDSQLYHTEKFIVLGSPPAEGKSAKFDRIWNKTEDNYEKRISSFTLEATLFPDLSRIQDMIDKEWEQPIFSVRAHVFQIDPDTKKNWLPASKNAVAVSYYYDSARNTYRIISVEGSKAIINSTITPNMAFTKTSQKFGQWSDPRANTVYGLGFGTETDLAKFIDKFKEVKDLTRQQASQTPTSPATVNGTSEDGGSASSTPREAPPRGFFHARSSSLTSMREPLPPNAESKEAINLRERRNSFNNPGSNGTTGSSSPESQLKYENDRLKLALAQSSSNAKKWEIELMTLKNNNARLTAALQESTSNVEEWKRQLAAYKEESIRMKKKLSEYDKQQGSPEEMMALQTEVGQMAERLEALERDNKYKDEEVDRLQQRLAEMTTKETANGNLQNKIKVDVVKALEEENRAVLQKAHNLEQLLKDHSTSQETDRDELLQLQDHLGSKITELYEFHEQILATIRKESNS